MTQSMGDEPLTITDGRAEITGMERLTDEEFLDRLADDLATRSYPENIEQMANHAADHAISEGRWPAGQREEYLQMFRDNVDPILMRKGMLPDFLGAFALSCVPRKTRPLVQGTPVRIIATDELNAFALQTPRGNPAVILNSALFESLRTVFYSVFVLLSGQGPVGSHSQRDFFNAILAMKQAVLSGTGLPPCENPIGDLVSQVSAPQEAVTDSMCIALVFVTLHEYGHIANGDHRNHAMRSVRVASHIVKAYRASHQREFAADLFAVNCIRFKFRTSARRRALLFPIATLLCFFALFDDMGKEMLGSHPRSQTRLRRIALMLLDGDARAVKDALDPLQTLFWKLARIDMLRRMDEWIPSKTKSSPLHRVG